MTPLETLALRCEEGEGADLATMKALAERLREVAGIEPKNWRRHRDVAQRWAAEAAIALEAAAKEIERMRGGVRVRALEWHRVTYGWLAFGEWYRIEDQGHNWPTERYWLYERGERLGKFDTFDAANNAMQERHNARIRSAMGGENAE